MGKVLEPRPGCAVCQPWVSRADQVRMPAVASHELITKVRKIVRADCGRRVEIRVHTGSGGIIDRSWPVAEISSSLLSSGNVIVRRTGGTAEPETFVVDEE